jgi:L-asparaginase II
MPLTVVQLRGGLPETSHPVSAVLSDGARTVWSVGPDDACFWRSGCKPLQLTTSLEALPADVVAALSDADLAVGASSHSGQPAHVARVADLLAQFGLAEEGLRCGAHLPIHEASARAVAMARAIHNNCSGKHTFMLAAARAQGWDADYLPLDHPLQARNRARIRQWTDGEPGVAVDGCGVPTFHVPVSGMARAFGRLAIAMADGDGLPGRIGRAMQRHPEMVSGEGRLDLAVTTQATEPLACKVGAEGLFDIALPGRRLGLVVKVWTGNADALAVAVRAVLAEVAPGVLPEALPQETVVNVVGRVVGERVAVWS